MTYYSTCFSAKKSNNSGIFWSRNEMISQTFIKRKQQVYQLLKRISSSWDMWKLKQMAKCHAYINIKSQLQHVSRAMQLRDYSSLRNRVHCAKFRSARAFQYLSNVRTRRIISKDSLYTLLHIVATICVSKRCNRVERFFEITIRTQ